MRESETTSHGDAAIEKALDAAWEALETGDVAAARRRVARLDPESPDTLLLLAACFREEDDATQGINRAAHEEEERSYGLQHS